MRKERSEFMLGIEIIAICLKKRHNTLSDITKKIYGNDHEKNKFRVFQCIELFIKHDVLKPVMNSNIIGFKIDDEILKNMEK